MDTKRQLSWAGAALACVFMYPLWPAAAQSTQNIGPLAIEEVRSPSTLERVYFWNDAMRDANALDHTPVAPGEARVAGEQAGPTRTSRAFAIVQIAVFDAVDAIVGGYRSYTGVTAKGAPGASVSAAIAQAAHDTLVALYPSQQPTFDALLATDLNSLANGTAKDRGISVGAQAAAAILQLRVNDGSAYAEPAYGTEYIPSSLPGFWRQDPIAQQAVALGAYWGGVRPFVIPSSNHFRAPPPPAMTSDEYTAAYMDVLSLGGDGVQTPHARTADQTLAGQYWGYDGAARIGTPPRMYNQITVQLARAAGLDVIESARLLALVNTAMADAGISAWETKYYYNFWRPVTGIRESDPGTGPSGLGDGNSGTAGDVSFVPLGAQASNTTNLDFTPPFPAYPSGHATFGGALFQTLRGFFGTDDIAFTFVSDEYNGNTVDNSGVLRPYSPRSFSTLSQAEMENARSRIYLGVHWQFDGTAGVDMGRSIGSYVIANAFTPL